MQNIVLNVFNFVTIGSFEWMSGREGAMPIAIQ